MNVRISSSRKKYSARSLAAGSVFCPACRKLTDRDARVCPACGFFGEQTMAIFPLPAPALEPLSDHAEMIGEDEGRLILKAIHAVERQYPQIRWKVVTAGLKEDEDVGLFGFWLVNVSPAGSGETLADRPWTVMLLILTNGDIAVVPGYAAEVWLSGQDWTQLLRVFQKSLRKTGSHARSVVDFLKAAQDKLGGSWQRAKRRVRKARNRGLTELK